MTHNFLIGIDEAGRGPLAGPLFVGAVMAPAKARAHQLFDISRDSKQMSEGEREEWFAKIKDARDEGIVTFQTAFIGPALIDRCGISRATALAVARSLAHLRAQPAETRVLLDGLLRAPRTFPHQETIIRGDETEPLIALASVVAKVSRDGYMRRLAARVPDYGFERHKGYGTRRHVTALMHHGLSTAHRITFCGKYLQG